jgi:hypothetical protein
MGITPQALEVAARGLPVFPCGANKRPAISKAEGGNGFLDARTEREWIEAVFARPNAHLIGVPTGQVSEFDVLDIDYRHGGKVWEDANLHRLPETRIHSSQSGGRHYLFRHAPGVRNNAGKIAQGIDIRGDGGYVIVPPSPGYGVVSDAPIAAWPDWLLDSVLSRPADEDERHHQVGPTEPLSSKRLQGFVDSVIAKVRTAPEGRKHEYLRNAALTIGGIQVAAGLSDQAAIDRLFDALPETVKDWKNARATTKWALEKGRLRPIDLPDRPEYAPRKPAHIRLVSDVEPAPDEASAPHQEDDKPSVFDVEYFRDIAISTDASDFVEGLLVTGGMSVIYGESNSGKTFFVTDLALHIAAGWAWRGREVKQLGVIYCALEGAAGIRKRVTAFRLHHGLDDRDLPFGVITVSLNLLDPAADKQKLIRTIAYEAERLGIRIGLVVMDTLSRAMAGGNENAPDDMGAMVTNGTAIQQATEAHVAWIHHSGKDQAKGARGHSLLRAATDTEIEITADVPARRVARVTKQRELECAGEFTFSLKVVELGTDTRGKPITSCIVDHDGAGGVESGRISPPRRLTGHNKRALEILADLVATSGQGGYAGVPSGVNSVPEKWWRERFYERAMPGDSDDAKQKAFRRASDALLNEHFVGMANRRVWLAYERTDDAPT